MNAFNSLTDNHQYHHNPRLIYCGIEKLISLNSLALIKQSKQTCVCVCIGVILTDT